MSSSSADPGSSATSAAGVGGHPSQAPAGDLASATATLTLTEEGEGEGTEQVQVLRLRLQPRRSVHWDETVENNEGLGRKSSKRCCIFHKQRPFGESSTDSSDDDDDGEGHDSDGSGSSSSSGGNGPGHRKKKKKAAARKKKKGHREMGRPKQGDRVPDSQRYHA